MPAVKPIAPVRIGNSDIIYAQGIRAGSWLFFTGHEATDFENGIAASVAGVCLSSRACLLRNGKCAMLQDFLS